MELLLIAQQPHQHFNIAKRRRRKRRRQHLYSTTKGQDRGNEWLLDFHTFSQRRRGGLEMEATSVEHFNRTAASSALEEEEEE